MVVMAKHILNRVQKHGMISVTVTLGTRDTNFRVSSGYHQPTEVMRAELSRLDTGGGVVRGVVPLINFLLMNFNDMTILVFFTCENLA